MIGLRIVIVGQIVRRNPTRHALINRITLGIVALTTVTHSRLSTLACPGLLVLSATSIDRLREERTFRTHDRPACLTPKATRLSSAHAFVIRASVQA